MSRKAQTKILAVLTATPGLSVDEVAAVTGYTPASCQHHIAELRKRGSLPANPTDHVEGPAVTVEAQPWPHGADSQPTPQGVTFEPQPPATPYPDPIHPIGETFDHIIFDELDPDPADRSPAPAKPPLEAIRAAGPQGPITWTGAREAESAAYTSGYSQVVEVPVAAVPPADEAPSPIQPFLDRYVSLVGEAIDRGEVSAEIPPSIAASIAAMPEADRPSMEFVASLGLTEPEPIVVEDLRADLIAWPGHVKLWAASTAERLGITVDELRGMPTTGAGASLGETYGSLAGRIARGEALDV